MIAFNSAFRIPHSAFVAVGVFDGVHLGHQAVIRRAMEDAAKIRGTAVVMTFDPHPLRVLRPQSAPKLLTATPHKVQLMRELGVESLIVHPFDAEFAALPPEEFVEQLCAAAPSLQEICVGHQWVFGRNRSGNVELLNKLGAKKNFRVVEVPQVKVGGRLVSSTRIRHAIESGNFAEARLCLGRDYTILGTVCEGVKLGKQLGFPTANLQAHSEQFPPNGVYAVRVRLDGESHGGVANIGCRPTLPGPKERILEVHLFDFDRSIYGKDLDVQFVQFLRDEEKFPSLDALKKQIARDVEQGRKLLMG